MGVGEGRRIKGGRTPYGPKTRSAEFHGPPRVASPPETSELESASVPEPPRITQETPKSWTRRIPPARQPFMTDTSVAAVTTTWLDRAGEVGHCWFIQTARELSRKRNGSRHFGIGSFHYRRSQGLSPAVSDRSSFRAIRERIFGSYAVAESSQDCSTQKEELPPDGDGSSYCSGLRACVTLSGLVHRVHGAEQVG